MIDFLFSTLKTSIFEIVYLIGIIIAAGMILGFFERIINNLLISSFGRKGILVTAWLGTPVHELGHAIMCLIFGHSITKIKLLDTKSETGILGYVEHSYNPRSLYKRIGNFFIAIGPIISGTLVLIASLYLLLPKTFTNFKFFLIRGISINNLTSGIWNSTKDSVIMLLKDLFAAHNLSNPYFYIYLLIGICISSHIALSKADMKGAQDGLIVIFALIFAFNSVLRLLSIDSVGYVRHLSNYNAHVLGFLIIAIIFSSLTLIISFICYFVSSLFK